MNRHGKAIADDVRMRGFRQRHTVAAALEWLDAQLRVLEKEEVSLGDAAGRVLAAAVVSDIDVPGFDRATMDGFAVVAASTEGAGAYSRVPLRVNGESLPGRPFEGSIGSGEAVRVMTGAPIPRGADAVLPAEYVDVDSDGPPEGGHHEDGPPKGGDYEGGPPKGGHYEGGPAKAGHYAGRINALAAVTPWKNVGRSGEDVRRGTVVLEGGRILRPQDLGVLSSIGRARVDVVRRPLVRLVVTGNELLPAGSTPAGVRIADANGPMLTALIDRDGGLVEFPGLVGDDETAIRAALHAEADIVIVSGGSSVGVEDFAPLLVAEHGDLPIHGIAMRPSSPTGLGRIGHRLVFLLPGNPVSSLCAYDFFAGRAIRALGGRKREWPYRSVRATLNRKIASPIGRLDYARVRLADGEVEPLAVGGASVLSSTTRADGFVIVPDDSEGYAEGAEVVVWLYA